MPCISRQKPTDTVTRFRLGWVGVGILLGGWTAAGTPSYKIQVRESGVYRVTGDDLVRTGTFRAGIRSDRLGLRNSGQPVPIWIEDGGDGTFDPGDSIEFVGRRLAGKRGHLNEFSEYNVYRLETDGGSRMRMDTPALGGNCRAQPGQVRRVHLERDRLRVRFSTHAGADQEVWFWHRMSPLETHPVAIDLPIQDVDATSPALLRGHFRGWSRPPRKNSQADHQVELVLNGRRLGFTDWDNDVDGFLFEAALRPSALRSGPNRLELRVPRRVETGGSRAAVDVVLLNWIEVLYRRRPFTPVEPILLEPTTDDCLAFEAGSEARLLLYDEAGGRVSLDVPRGGRGLIKWRPEGSIWVVPRGAWRSPAAITVDRPSDLRARGHEADYLILSHS